MTDQRRKELLQRSNDLANEIDYHLDRERQDKAELLRPEWLRLMNELDRYDE